MFNSSFSRSSSQSGQSRPKSASNVTVRRWNEDFNRASASRSRSLAVDSVLSIMTEGYSSAAKSGEPEFHTQNPVKFLAFNLPYVLVLIRMRKPLPFARRFSWRSMRATTGTCSLTES